MRGHILESNKHLTKELKGGTHKSTYCDTADLGWQTGGDMS